MEAIFLTSLSSKGETPPREREPVSFRCATTAAGAAAFAESRLFINPPSPRPSPGNGSQLLSDARRELWEISARREMQPLECAPTDWTGCNSKMTTQDLTLETAL